MRTFGHQEVSLVSLHLACLADWQFTKEEIQMSNWQMEKYASSLPIKEIPKISFLISQFGKSCKRNYEITLPGLGNSNHCFRAES